MADEEQFGFGCVTPQSEEQFWQELSRVCSTKCMTTLNPADQQRMDDDELHELMDDALRSWLYLVAACRDAYLPTEDDVATCSQMLVDSEIFSDHKEYVRKQIIHSLLDETEAGPLHVIANFLLLDGRSDDDVFREMIDRGCFLRLLHLINGTRENDRRLHRLLLELIYEMSRIERIRTEDLLQVSDALVIYMFQVIESQADDVDGAYHYPIIRVLLVLNEQYMVAATTAAVEPSTPDAALPLTNRVIKILSLRGDDFRTFGENIILLLNRETETSLQLLILKLLYLLFTTKATYEYFYTNDLRVLLDVIIRNLLDLPNEAMALRHTYLRVLYPLLAHTQLSRPPHYKRDEVKRLLRILGGSENAHFAPADETTVRLVERVSGVPWLGAELGGGEVAGKFLGISLSESQIGSCASVADVAAVMEKPGVKTPSRKAVLDAGADQAFGKEKAAGETREAKAVAEPPRQAVAKPKRVLPAVPKHRHGKLLNPATAAPPTAILHTNGNGNHSHNSQKKKVPPKAPPPRRGTRLKQSASTTNLQGQPESMSMPVS